MADPSRRPRGCQRALRRHAAGFRAAVRPDRQLMTQAVRSRSILQSSMTRPLVQRARLRRSSSRRLTLPPIAFSRPLLAFQQQDSSNCVKIFQVLQQVEPSDQLQRSARSPGELLLARRQEPSCRPTQPGTLPTPTRANGHKAVLGSNGRDDLPASDQSKSRTIAQCFLRLSNLDPTLLDRAGSYEARLWRQAAQTIWTLQAMRQPPPPMRQRLRHRAAPFTWDRER
jgi:hypothetical protein